MDNQTLNVKISPIFVFKSLMVFVLFLLCANIIGITFQLYFERPNVYGLVPIFNFDTESSIPALYSSIALLFTSLLLSIVALVNKKNNLSWIPWAVLAVIFIFLGIDETVGIHERTMIPTRKLFQTSGILYNAWVIPYSILLLIFVISYLKFLIRLPRKIMKLFIFSGLIFIAGAIGFESLSGRYGEVHGINNFLYSFYYTCEETLEMIGIILFIYAILTYLSDEYDSFKLVITLDDKVN